MEISEKVERIPIKDDEQIEVSYSILYGNKRSYDELIQDISAAINLQLGLDDQSLPFIEPAGFDIARYQDKLFIHGLSGSGKSRIIIEIIRNKRQQLRGLIEKVYIINPRQRIGEKTGRTTLIDLINQFTESDIIVWDNFPDDLIKRDIDNARKALEIISSSEVRNLLVALKPEYLEIYRGVNNKIPELYGYEISFTREKIRDIIKSYGSMTHFTTAYRKYIENDIDKVSTILWEKEPIPLIILNYFKELDRKIQLKAEVSLLDSHTVLDAALEAKDLFSRAAYYEHLFTQLSNIQERKPDLDFLYTLRLCYELRLDRDINVIRPLQSGIFDTICPSEPSRSLSAWIYMSGRDYSMHDAPREAVKFTDSVKIKIVNYLTNNFLQVIPDNDNHIFSFGIFIGNNIGLIPQSDSRSDIFLPNNLYEYMKKKKYFGEGIGQVFIYTKGEYEDLQTNFFDKAKHNAHFAKGLGLGLGLIFRYLKEKIKQGVSELVDINNSFAIGIGEGMGIMFTQYVDLGRETYYELISGMGSNITFTL